MGVYDDGREWWWQRMKKHGYSGKQWTTIKELENKYYSSLLLYLTLLYFLASVVFTLLVMGVLLLEGYACLERVLHWNEIHLMN